MSRPSVLVIDAGLGNIGSVLAALQNGPEPAAWIAGEMHPRGDGPSMIFDHLDGLGTAL